MWKSESQIAKVPISVENISYGTASCLVSFQEQYTVFWLAAIGSCSVDETMNEKIYAYQYS